MALLDLFPSNAVLITISVSAVVLVGWLIILVHKQKKPTFKQEHRARKRAARLQRKEEKVEKREEKAGINIQINVKKEKEELGDVAVELPQLHDLASHLLRTIEWTSTNIKKYLETKSPDVLDEVKSSLGYIAQKVKETQSNSKDLLHRFKNILEEVHDDLQLVNELTEDTAEEKLVMANQVLQLKKYRGKNMDVSEKLRILLKKFALLQKSIGIQNEMKEVTQVEINDAKDVVEKYRDLQEKGEQLREELGAERKEWADYLELLEKIKPFAKEALDFWEPSKDFYNNSFLREKELSKLREELQVIQDQKADLDKVYDSLEIKEFEKEEEEQKQDQPEQLQLPI
tara:strand:- start:14069 stop:15100 length:1032 start_codon:yes stop_codon:yes gene_type:complete